MRAIVLAVMLSLIGCAGISVKPGDAGKGIRYYQNSPYILVYTDNSGGLKTELIFLPDATKVMSAYPYSILATNSTTLEFDNGVLKSGEAEVDTAVVPRAVVSALEKVATASIAAALREPVAGKPNAVAAPRLFKIEWNPATNDAYLVGRDGPVCAGAFTDINVKGKPQAADPAKAASPCQPGKTRVQSDPVLPKPEGVR